MSTAVQDVWTLTDNAGLRRLQSPVRTPSMTDSEQSEWEQSTRRQVHNLLRIERDWDGYGAGPIRKDVLVFSLELLYKVMTDEAPPPHITPMAHGGVMLEWHVSGIDLEIEIEAPGIVWVSYEDTFRGEEKEWGIKADFGSISEPIYSLTTHSAPGRPS